MHTPERRQFLKNGRTWLKLGVILSLSYPLCRFLAYKIGKKPQHIKVKTIVRQTGFAVERDFILFDRKNHPWAVSRRCTHLGCRLTYQEQEDILICPCHQSRFTPEGKRISGPAQRDLAVFPVKVLSEQEGYLVTI